MDETLYHEYNWYFNNWCYCHSFSIHASSQLFLSFPVSPHDLRVVKHLGLHWETQSCKYFMYVKYVFLMCVNIVLSTCLSKASKLRLCWWPAFAGFISPTFFIWISCKAKYESHAKLDNIVSFPYIQGVTQDSSSRATQRLLDLFIPFSHVTLNFFSFVCSGLCSCDCRIFQCCEAWGWGAGSLKE